MMDSIPQVFATTVRHDPTHPLLTWYDDDTGDRTELSGATLDNWVAKTANLLVDDAGLGPGDTVAVLLPPHWQTAAVLLGCWTAGLAVDHGGDPQPVEALFSTADGAAASTAWSTGERYATALAPLAAPLRQVPPGFADYVVEVRAQGDRFAAYQPVLGDDRAVAGPVEMSHRTVCAEAATRAADLGIGPGDRVLVDARSHPEPLDWLLAPLVAGASIVLCGSLDETRTAARVAAEKITVNLARSPV